MSWSLYRLAATLVTYHLVDPSLLHLTANNRVGENWKSHLNSGPKIQIGCGDETPRVESDPTTSNKLKFIMLYS